jgi:hypothetical protein
MKLIPFSILALVSLGTVAGCGAIPIQMHTESHVQHMDGTVDHKSSDWQGTLDQLPAQLDKAGGELGDVTAKMVKELTEVPAPGKVELKDLSPELSKYQGQRGADFLVTARDDKGEPIKFEYVRLGQAEFDDFFKTTQEIYALVYQTTQVISQMKQIAGKLLDAKVEGGANLHAQVDKALHAEAEGSIVADLRMMQDMGSALATLVPQIAAKLGKLVQTGQALVMAAPTALTNPKVVAHLGLVKKGLLSSAKVLTESGSLMVGFTKDLSGFSKS